MIDFFGYRLEEDWKSNPSVYSWVTRNGVIVPSKRDSVNEVTCAKGLRVLGAEETHRLTTSGLDQYLTTPPEIPGLVNCHPLDDLIEVRKIWGREII